MSDRGQGRGFQRGRGDPRGGGRGRGGEFRGGRGAYPAQRGFPTRGGPPGGLRAAPPMVKAPEEPAPKVDARITSIDQGVQKFQALIRTNRQVKHPLRPGFGTLGTPILVRANFFALKFPKGLIIYEYKIDITAKSTSKSTSKSESGPMKGRIIELLEESPDFDDYRGHIAHDSSEKMVSSRKLPQPLTIDITYRDDGEKSARPDAKRYTVSLVEVENNELDTDLLTEYTNGDPALQGTDINRLLAALNIIVQSNSARTGTRVGKNRYFFGPAQNKLSDGVEAWRGYFASVRPVWKSMMVNINVCMTAFVQPRSMAVAIMSYRDGSKGSFPNLGELFQKSPLKVRVKHLGYKRKVRAIVDKRPDQMTFLCEELGNKKVTVAQYFKEKYPQFPLSYPNLPLIDLGSEKRPNYVPAELCDIIQGVPFRGKLQDIETSNMLNLACQNPQTNSQLIRGEGFSHLAIAESSRHSAMQSFGITIDQNMTVIPARILPPPTVTYREGRVSINDASWNLRDVKFHRGAAMGRFAVFLIQEADIQPRFSGEKDPDLWKFLTEFRTACINTGMTVATDPPLVKEIGPLPRRSKEDPSRSAAMAKIKEVMNMFSGSAKAPPSIILVLLHKYDTHLYAGIKRLGDVDMGINTVFMLLDKAANPAKQAQYFANVALKINAKLRGINHKLDARDQQWLQERRTMLVGADVTHPGPSSLRGAPSLAAVVASVDSDFVQFPASMRLQNFAPDKEAQEMIHHWEPMMVERLEYYQSLPVNKGQLPERVIIFRDGVSEGQFGLVLDKELPQIQDAFKRVYATKPLPQLTICICGKRHHARFYPTDDKRTRNGNTKPGTIVDKGIGDVYRFDFYLQAHAGLQGTVKATHYTVVYDQIGFSANTIQQGTHTSSYLYARATKGVSLVPPAYYADLACERGRLYLNEFLNGGADKSETGTNRKDKDAAQKAVYDACVKSWGSGIHERLKNSMFYI